VTLEAASPGDIKSGGTGHVITYGHASSPFGRCLIASTARGVCHLAFVDAGDGADALEPLRAEWPRATLRHDDAHAAGIAQAAFQRGAPVTDAPLRAYVRGTPFQVRVWRALLRIPHGGLVTYGDLAATLGAPRSARAVGTAVGRNPLAVLIPCHRVIRETGIVGGYRWGGTRKRAILAWESATQRVDQHGDA